MTAPSQPSKWVLTLYVSGASPRSLAAIETVRRLCEEDLGDDVELEIVDVHENPSLVVRDDVIAAPTLVRRMPAPLRRLVGDLSDSERVRSGLDLGPVTLTVEE
jgi:circadian clock protein KaiB